MVRLSFRVLHLWGLGNAPSDVLLFIPLVDIHVTMLRTTCTEENWHNVFVDVDSEAYTVFFGSVTTASFTSSARFLESSGVQRSDNWVHFPDCNFNGVIVFWDQYGLLCFLGKKGIYSGAFYPVVQADGVAGSNTADVGPNLRARKCQHIAEFSGRLAGALQDFDNFYSTALAGLVFCFLTGLGALREGVYHSLLGSTRTMLCRRADQAVTAPTVGGARQEINEVEMSVSSFKGEPLFPMGWVRVSFVSGTECVTKGVDGAISV